MNMIKCALHFKRKSNQHCPNHYFTNIIPPIKSSQIKSNAGFRWTRWKSPESQRQWCDQQIIEEIDDTIWWIHDGKITLKKQADHFLLSTNLRHYVFSRHVLTTITIMKICWFIKHLWMILQVRLSDKIFSVRIICNPSICHLFDTLFCF